MRRWESAVCLHCESHRSDFLCAMPQYVLSRRGDAGPSGLPWVQPGWGRQTVTGLTKEESSLRCFKHQHHILSFESIFKSWLIKTVELQGSDWSCVRFLGPANKTLLIIPVIWWACPRGSGLLESISTRGGEGACLSPAWCIDVMPALVTQFLYITVLSFFSLLRGLRLSFPYSSPLLSVLKNVQKVLLIFVSTPISKDFKSKRV